MTDIPPCRSCYKPAQWQAKRPQGTVQLYYCGACLAKIIGEDPLSDIIPLPMPTGKKAERHDN